MRNWNWGGMFSCVIVTGWAADHLTSVIDRGTGAFGSSVWLDIVATAIVLPIICYEIWKGTR